MEEIFKTKSHNGETFEVENKLYTPPAVEQPRDN